MELRVRSSLALFGIFMYTGHLHYECRKLDGYDFPVYSTKSCPRNQLEWNKRSSAIKCNESNGYMCLPNENITELLEFCFVSPFVLIQEEFCLYLNKRFSLFGSYRCSHFKSGCHNTSFLSYELFEHQSCTSIGNGCFLAEPTCKSDKTTTQPQKTTDTIFTKIVITAMFTDKTTKATHTEHHGISNKIGYVLVATILGLFITTCIFCLMCMYLKKGPDATPEDYQSIYVQGRKHYELEETDVDELSQLNSRQQPDRSGTIKEGPDATPEDYQGIYVQGRKHYKLEETDVDELSQLNSRQQPDRSRTIKEDDKNIDMIQLITTILIDIHKTQESNIKQMFVEQRESLENVMRRGDFCSVASSTLAITDAQTIEIISEKVISHFSTSGDSAIGKRNSRLGFETRTEKTTLEQWKEVNKTFVLTRACKKVESLIKSKNLVVVTGESGSGKSAIIQHIALSYKSQGWTVKPEYEVIKLINAYSLKGVSQTKTLFVFNDPFGKSSLDEKAYSSWKKNEKHINLYRQNVKILLSCRGYILNDSRVEGLLRNEAYVVDLSKNDLQLSSDEKQSILKNYTFNDNSSEETFGLVFDFEAYVQFFYEVYTSGEEQLEKLQCFKEPLSIFEKEIRAFKTSCEMKYCALVLLVLFNNKLLLANILEDNESRKKYHYAMDLLNILKSTKPELFRDILKTMEGFFVKKINEFYQFYNDFVMEVTTYVFGTDHPREMIKYADIGFLRRRVKLKSFKVESEQYTIYLPDSLISDLGKRLFEDIFGERLLDVVLNPCLKNEKVAKTFMKELKGHPEKIKMLVQKKKIEIKSKDVWQKSTSLLLSKIVFLNLEDKISPLDAVIVLGHTDLALYCVKALQKTLSENESRFLFPVVCCNGSLDLFTVLKKDNVKDFLVEKWESFYPIHIVSAFHNYEILVELVNIGVDVNLQTCCKNKWSPLALAAWNDTEENENKHRYNTGQKRRDVTVQLLLESGADINLCVKNKMSPLYTACKNGHDSTVQILLNYKADINLCDENGASPLLITCKEGHDSTVQLLLSNGADVNLCDENGVSPLLVTCQEGHDSTVQLLLNNGADVDLCKTYVTSPLHVACREGHDSTVQLLLNNRADVNLCDENGVSSLLIACLEGHDSTVQLLLKNGAHVDLCTTFVTSPLHVACQEGHDSTVQLLLNNGADVNLCDENTFSSLLIACLEGHDSTVQLLLNNGADVNFCDETGFSPLLAACLEGHDSTVQLLLNSGADVNLCDKHGFSPLFVACQEGYDSTAQLVLNYGAKINSCERNGASPLLIACQCGNADTAKLLLSQGADFNLSTKHGFSPLYLALAFRLHETVKLLIEYGANTSIENGCGFKSVSFDSNDKDDKTLQFLIQEDNVINNIHDPDSYFSLFVFCQVEEILQIICNQYEF